ncbi:MAG: radical SAM protein [Clostridia bacterium]|nr:radical SAM protein [Clostridia bacterium]
MKNVYLVQPNNALSESSCLPSAVYLPYAVGAIAAYSFSKEDIKKNYNLCDFIFTKMPIDTALEEIKDPYIVGFSNYMWSVEYNLALAEAIKKKWPRCIIAFGGVQVPDDTEYLEEYPFIDLLMHSEGEVTFYKLLTELSKDGDLENVPNISYRKNGVAVQTKKELGPPLEDFPSPYTMGLFDYIVNNPEYKNIQFDTVIETNRGCPYRCVFCCWRGNKSGFRQFPMEKVKAELDWLAEHKISYCFCADSNFGILERDEEIAEYIVNLKKKYGYPQRFESTAAKNKDDMTYRILRKLEDADLNRGVSIAVQSMSPEVLEIVGRKNMSVNNFAEQVARYRTSGMYTYTDLILGLPGETFDSFCKGLCKVIEAGQHSNVSVYRCEFLPNTIMYTKEFVEKYKIKTVRSLLCQIHTRVDEDMKYASRSDIVVGTSTLSTEEWEKAFRFSVCVQSFHSLGLLKFVAIYLRKARNISYYDFYMNLYEWIENESKVIKRILDRVFECIDAFLKGEGNLCFSDERFGNIYWEFYEGLFLSCAAEFENFYEDVINYLKQYFDDNKLFEDLLLYQKTMVALPSQEEKIFDVIYDWHEYFENLFNPSYLIPKEKLTTLKVEKSSTDDWVDYAHKRVWYGKRYENTINIAEKVK